MLSGDNHTALIEPSQRTVKTSAALEHLDVEKDIFLIYVVMVSQGPVPQYVNPLNCNRE